jgi:putative transposase
MGAARWRATFGGRVTQGYTVGRKRIRRLMAKMGLAAVYQRPRTTVPHPEHRKWPYLLRGVVIDRPDQVWCADITYTDAAGLSLPRRGHGLGEPARAGLAAVQQFAMRPPSVRGPWRTDADFCIEALEEAMSRYGRPEIFNTDQGSQFSSPRFTDVLTAAGVKVSMDGKGRWMDNIFIERLWRSLKYECVYLHAFDTGSEARAGIGRWMTYYNAERPHSALGGRTPLEAHAGNEGIKLAA